MVRGDYLVGGGGFPRAVIMSAILLHAHDDDHKTADKSDSFTD